MKDKEIIEEMAKIMCGNDCEECAKESAEFYKQTLEEARNNKCLLKNCAKTLYEQGYRKLPKDSVVLSKEEYNDLILAKKTFASDGEEVSSDTLLSTFKGIKEQARKETAEKILKWLVGNKHLFNRTHEIGFEKPRTSYLVLNDEIEELAKQYGVEIKE